MSAAHQSKSLVLVLVLEIQGLAASAVIITGIYVHAMRLS